MSKRWLVCALLFLATTINYMDRSVLSLVEPLLHQLPFMGWNPALDPAHQSLFNNNYGDIIICFQIAYGLGLLTAGRIIDRIGTRIGYALAITLWALASMSHAFVSSVLGFAIARFLLGLGESGNFPAAIKAVTEWFPPQERALATGIFNSGSNASAFIAPALVAFVTYRFGWQAAFLTTGSFGLLWLILWLLFPYNKLLLAQTPLSDLPPEKVGTTPSNFPVKEPGTTLSGAPSFPALSERVGSTELRHSSNSTLNPNPGAPSSAVSSPQVGPPELRPTPTLRTLLHQPGLYAFSLAKGLTDPIWWFYLFYLPKFLNENYGLDLHHAYWEIVCVYAVSSLGSIGGGALSGFQMRRGHSVNFGRKFALLVCALGVTPIVLVPYFGRLFPTNAWPAVALISLAAAAHQGWSANLFTTPSDLFPAGAVSTVVGIGGATGALGGAAFTWLVKHFFSLHPLPIFALAASAYLLALLIFQTLAPHLGLPANHAKQLQVTK